MGGRKEGSRNWDTEEKKKVKVGAVGVGERKGVERRIKERMGQGGI